MPTQSFQATLSSHIAPSGNDINYIQNPSFEYDTTGSAPAWWETGGNAFSTKKVEEGWAQSGKKSLRLTTPNDALEHNVQKFSTNTAFPHIIGSNYTLKVTFNVLTCEAPRQIRIFIEFWNAAEKKEISNAKTFTTSTGIQTLTISGVVPANTTEIRIFAPSVSGASGVVDLYMDAVQLTQTSSPIEYFDGDTAGYEWEGTPGNSISKKSTLSSFPPLSVTHRLLASISSLGALKRTITNLIHAWFRLGQLPSNLIPNPSFETTASGWFAGFQTKSIAKSSAQSKIGTSSLEIVPETGRERVFANARSGPESSGVFFWRKGLNYSGRLWVRIPSAGKWSAFLGNPSSTITFQCDQKVFETTGAEWIELTWTNREWTKFVGTINVNENASFTFQLKREPGTFTEAEKVYLDGVQLVESTTLPAEYADGAQTGYVWGGGTEESPTYAVRPSIGVRIISLTASISSAASLIVNIIRATAAKLSFLVSLAELRISRVIFASISSVVSTIRISTRQISAILKLQVSIIAEPIKIFVVKLLSEGVLPRDVLHFLFGSLSFKGLLPRNILRTILASTSFQGTLDKIIDRNILASITSSAFLPRDVIHQLQAKITSRLAGVLPAMSAKLEVVGSLPRNTSHIIKSSLEFVGRLKRNIAKRTKSELTTNGVLARSITHQLSNELSFLGILFHNPVRVLLSQLSFEGKLSRVIYHPVKATLESVASLQRSISRAILSFIELDVAFPSTVIKSISSEINSSAALGKFKIIHQLRPILSFRVQFFHTIIAFLVELSFSGSLHKEFELKRKLEAKLTSLAVVGRKTSHTMQASVTSAVSYTRNVLHQSVSRIESSAVLARKTSKALRSSLLSAGFLPRRTAHQVSAVLSLLANLQRRTGHRLFAGLELQALGNRVPIRFFKSALNMSARLGLLGYVVYFKAKLGTAARISRRTIQRGLQAVLRFAQSFRQPETPKLIDYVSMEPRNISRLITNATAGPMTFEKEFLDYPELEYTSIVAKLIAEGRIDG